MNADLTTNIMHIIGASLKENSTHITEPVAYNCYNSVANLFIKSATEHQNDFSYANDLEHIYDVFSNNYIMVVQNTIEENKDYVESILNNIRSFVHNILFKEYSKISGQKLDYEAATIESVKSLIDSGGHIGENAVPRFATLHKYEIADFLLKSGAKIYFDSITYRLQKENSEAALYLYQNGAKVQVFSVELAFYANDFANADILISYGGKLIDFTIENNIRHAAICDDNIEAVKFLLKNGARFKNNLIADLIMSGKYEYADLLVEYGNISEDAVFYTIIYSDYKAAKWLLEHNATIEKCDILTLICQHNIDGATWLLDHGAVLNRSNIHDCPNYYETIEFLKEHVGSMGEIEEILQEFLNT